MASSIGGEGRWEIARCAQSLYSVIDMGEAWELFFGCWIDIWSSSLRRFCTFIDSDWADA